MTAEMVPLTFFQRPPHDGPPPPTTFDSGDGFDRDMLVVLRDQVDRLVREIRYADTATAPSLATALRTRQSWIEQEMRTELMFSAPPAPPFDIPTEPYDLQSLRNEFFSPRLAEYRRLLQRIDEALHVLKGPGLEAGASRDELEDVEAALALEEALEEHLRDVG